MVETTRSIYSKVLSNNLTMLMKVYGYSRKQVCSAIGVPYTTYTDWVKGKSMFEHKSLKERIQEYSGEMEVYEYDWSDLEEGDYFNE